MTVVNSSGFVFLFHMCCLHSPWLSEMMVNVLNDADQLQVTFLTLLTNQTEAKIWIGHVMDSVMEVIMKVC